MATPEQDLPANETEVGTGAVPLRWLERHWETVAAECAHPRAGIFGPESMSWRINRESALFLGAGRAALLQLAHPWVAAALDQHSSLRDDPLARFHNTFRVVFTMIFGTLGQALAASRHLYRLHTGIQGRLPEAVAGYAQGSRYRANEVSALLWVYATLVESALLAYESALPPLVPAERERYYAESKTIAALFGIPREALPPDWAAFAAYNRAMIGSDALGVGAVARELADGVLRGAGSWVPVPRWYRALTASWLPERLRGEFALPYGDEEQAAVRRALRRLPRIYRSMPGALRFVGPYRQASARLAGRKAGSMIRANNRFWMGQPEMMFAEFGK